MRDIRLFKIGKNHTHQVVGRGAADEKSLQTQIERNLETLLGIRFLATEFTCKEQEYHGRIDTLGIDENNCPVIIEYKQKKDQNVVTQGLSYLNWLVHHRGDFKVLVQEKLGTESAPSVEWANPRLICIASDFSKFDEDAIKQMNRNIDLIRYINFDGDLLLLEHVNFAVGRNNESTASVLPIRDKPKSLTEELASLFEDLQAFIMDLGDDVKKKNCQNYIAFSRMSNFACVEIRPYVRKILVYVKLNPDSVELKDDFTRDMRNKGQAGTGDLEISLRTKDDLDSATKLIEQSYRGI